MASDMIQVNRAPVLTLWAAVVAERLGYKADEALTLGRVLAGLNAQAKGRRLGIYHPREGEPDHKRAERAGEELTVALLGREVPVVRNAEGVRATSGGRPMDAAGVQRYLESKFGTDLAAVREALEELARSCRREELAAHAYALYEQFRPDVPAGKPGWGATGELDLARIRQMAKRSQSQASPGSPWP